MAKSKIHALIPKVIKDLGAIDKNGFNKDDGYAFRLIDEVCQKIRPLFVKHNIFCSPEVLETREEDVELEDPKKQGRKIKGRLVVLKVKYKLYAQDGSAFEAVVTGEAMDESDKAHKKAMTAAFKTMITQVFCLSVGVKGLDTAERSPRLHFVDGPPPAPAREAQNSRPSKTVSRGKDMKIPAGRFSGRLVSEIPRRELRGYIDDVVSAMSQSGKKPPKWFYDLRKVSGL